MISAPQAAPLFFTDGLIVPPFEGERKGAGPISDLYAFLNHVSSDIACIRMVEARTGHGAYPVGGIE
jgi:hypothetical protein